MTSKRNNDIFNEDIKNMFLEDMVKKNTISEDTAKSYNRIFLLTSSDELLLNKDLNKFSLKELETVMYGFKANNRNTVESYARIVSSYLNWCVQNALSENNPLSSLKPSDFEKYLTNDESYITEGKLRRYEDMCENYQDAVILRLLFIGVGGNQMSEIRNLKKSDVDFNNKTIKLVNSLKTNDDGMPLKYTERTLKVDDHTLSLIEGAIKQKIYYKKNGLMDDAPINVRRYNDLVLNDYVVRASITKNSDNWNKPLDKFVIYRRIETISDVFGIEDMTAKFIQRSGMIYLANNIMADGNELHLDDLKIIADIFNVKSYHNLKGFLTVDNVRKTYKKKER